MHLIYLVGRDREVFSPVRRCLEDAGYPVCWFQHLAGMLSSASRHRPSLVVIFSDAIDDTAEVCRLIRSAPELDQVRLLVLGKNFDEEQRIAALDSGVDGFISSPFSPRELLWQMMKVQIRMERCVPRSFSFGAPVTLADFVVDNSSMKVTLKGRVVETTALEFKVLEFLARHQGRVFTRHELLHAIWGESHSGGLRSVDACIRRIRKKLEPNRKAPTYLKSIRGIGYRLDVN